MCGIWDWQSTIVKDLNDSQDPQNTLFCRDLRAFFRQQMSAFYPFRGGVAQSGHCLLFYRFSHMMASLKSIVVWCLDID